MLQPQTWPEPVNLRSVCLKGHLYQASPTSYSVRGSRSHPLVQEAPVEQVGAWLHLAGPAPQPAKLRSGCPPTGSPVRLSSHWLNPASPTSSLGRPPSLSPIFLFLSRLGHLPRSPSPWQTYTPLASKVNLGGNMPWVFLGLPAGCCLGPGSGQSLCRKKVGARPGAWAQLVAALLLLAVGFSLAVWQLHTRAGATETSGSGAPPPSGHSHRPGVYHHGAIISPAGQ